MCINKRAISTSVNASLNVHRRYIDSGTKGYMLAKAEGMHETVLVTQEKSSRTQHETILANPM